MSRSASPSPISQTLCLLFCAAVWKFPHGQLGRMANTLIRKKNIKQTGAKRHASWGQAAKRVAQLKRELRASEERWQAVMNNPIS